MCNPRAWGVVFFVLVSASGWAADKLYFGNQAFDLGQTGVTIPVLLDTDNDHGVAGGKAWHGFCAAVKYDQTKISIKDVTVVGTIAAVSKDTGWQNGQIFDAEGRLHWGVVLDTTDPIEDMIPTGNAQTVLILTADIVSTSTVQETTTIELKDGLNVGSEPAGGWVNILSYKGDAPTHPTLAAGTITLNPVVTGSLFQRGDANADGKVDLSDAVSVLGWLFLGGADPKCEESCNADSSDKVDLTDAVFILSFLFLGGKDPAAPFPKCDTVDAAKCAQSTTCTP
jgi:opacity protein-like surface antigen